MRVCKCRVLDWKNMQVDSFRVRLFGFLFENLQVILENFCLVLHFKRALSMQGITKTP